MKKSTKITILVFIAVIAIAIGLAYLLIKSGPKAQKRPPQEMTASVEVITLQKSNPKLVIEGTGVVEPAQDLQLKSQVEGIVIEVSEKFIEGKIFSEGEVILKIDPRDYEIAVKRAESNLLKAQSDYQIEIGKQNVAKHEYELINSGKKGSNNKLALRAPHLQIQKANLELAEANLEEAKLNLQRTTIRAPYNAVILSKNVQLGTIVARNQEIARIAGVENFWIKTSLPQKALEWIDLGNPASIEPVNFQKSAPATSKLREAKVLSIMGDLESSGRQARVILQIEDPLNFLGKADEGNESQKLMLNEFVKVKISADEVKSVFVLPRKSIRVGNSIWLLSPESTLEIRKIAPIWQDAKNAYVKEGLTEGEQLIISNLDFPVKGMKLQNSQSTSKPEQKKSQGIIK